MNNLNKKGLSMSKDPLDKLGLGEGTDVYTPPASKPANTPEAAGLMPQNPTGLIGHDTVAGSMNPENRTVVDKINNRRKNRKGELND